MRVSDAFPSKYLSANDLQGQSATFVIAKVEIEKLGDDLKPILYFQHEKKGMALNKTNANKIADIYGDDMDEWVGREIVLFPAMVDFKGDTVEAIRVRGPQPKDRRPANDPSRQMANREFHKPTTHPKAMAASPVAGDEPPPWEPDDR